MPSENRRNKLHHPAVTVGTLISILFLVIAIFGIGNALENQGETNKNKIESNEKLRLSEQQHTNSELKEIKKLLNQIILNQYVH